MVAKQKEERDSRWVWWREAGSTIRVNGSSVTKDRDAPDFGVALGEKEYTTGKHDVDFLINRSTDNYVYGASPSCPTPPACDTPTSSPAQVMVSSC